MQPIAFTHATVLDGTDGMREQRDTTVVVDTSGAIVAVGPFEEVSIPADARQIDLTGRYLAPGLINAHVHLCGTGKPTGASAAGNLMDLVTKTALGRAILHRIVGANARTQLLSGVTTLRTEGDPAFADVHVRDRIEQGRSLGPRIIAAGTGITVPNGHGAGLFARPVSSPDEAREAVRDCAAHTCNVIKLFITGGVFDAEKEGEPGVLRMPLEIAQAACEEAHALGLPVAAHIESPEGVRVGLEAGVDTVEHGSFLDDELIDLFKRNGAGGSSALTCTISPALPFVNLPAETTHSTEIQKRNGDIVYRGLVEAAKYALEQGIPVALGTDSSCPFVTQYDMWREVVYFNRIVGASTAQALHAATLGNAAILGIAEATGSVEVGKDADLIVLDRNPLENLEALRVVRMVMTRGYLVENPQVKRLEEIDRACDSFLPQA